MPLCVAVAIAIAITIISNAIAEYHYHVVIGGHNRNSVHYNSKCWHRRQVHRCSWWHLIWPFTVPKAATITITVTFESYLCDRRLFVPCDRWFEITTLLVLWSAKRYWFLCDLSKTDNLQLPVQPWSRKVSRREEFLKLDVQHMTGFLFRREDLGLFANYTSELRWLRSNP